MGEIGVCGKNVEIIGIPKIYKFCVNRLLY
jgi:hypothetical protein